MISNLTLAKQDLLDSAEITEKQLQTIVSGLLSTSVDAADIYLQSGHSESWVFEDGIVKVGSYDKYRGVGVRAISGEKTGFAYSDDILLPSLKAAANTAKTITRSGKNASIGNWKYGKSHNLYLPVDPLSSIDEAKKIDVLKRLDSAARDYDARVKQVISSLSASFETIMVLAADGDINADIRPLIRCNVTVIVEDSSGRRETASSGGGGRYTYNELLENDNFLIHSHEAARQAIVNLDAINAPAGMMPVVLGPGWPGVLLHEAVGHGLEGDFNRKGTSAFTGRIGERVASPLCTVVDDGTLLARRGSLGIDDEGVESQNTVLIEKGILKGYMQDKLNAKLMGGTSTGNGRRESYAHLPMPRMTNTYMHAGPHDPEEIIRSIDKGIYAVNFGGGQVDITSGQFVFSASEAYLIENGKITAPVKGATLIGNGPEVLTKVSMVGTDLELDQGVGVCGKDGQSVPVGVGQPTLKIDELTVGGTSYDK